MDTAARPSPAVVFSAVQGVVQLILSSARFYNRGVTPRTATGRDAAFHARPRLPMQTPLSGVIVSEAIAAGRDLANGAES